jgi:hypothetical protein
MTVFAARTDGANLVGSPSRSNRATPSDPREPTDCDRLLLFTKRPSSRYRNVVELAIGARSPRAVPLAWLPHRGYASWVHVVPVASQ